MLEGRVNSIVHSLEERPDLAIDSYFVKIAVHEDDKAWGRHDPLVDDMLHYLRNGGYPNSEYVDLGIFGKDDLILYGAVKVSAGTPDPAPSFPKLGEDQSLVSNVIVQFLGAAQYREYSVMTIAYHANPSAFHAKVDDYIKGLEASINRGLALI